MRRFAALTAWSSLLLGILSSIALAQEASKDPPRAEAPIPASSAKADEEGKLLWYDISHLNLEGKAWTKTKAPYDRLPAEAEGVVRDAVWGLSRHSAGMCVRFVADAPAIHARWTLTSDRLAMPHMPATGVSGLDLYLRTSDGNWRWMGVGRPQAQTNAQQLVSGLPEGKHEFLLYLPLYNGVSSVEIGIPKENTLAKAPAYPPEREKPLVFYGTSITHGACASRPGMAHPAILGRRLQRPVINLGFSGNGRMEIEIARLLAEIDAAVYIIDCLPNMNAEDVTQRVGPLVQTLRAERPSTPILLVEDRSYPNGAVLEGPRQHNETSRAALWAAYRKMLEYGVAGLHYLPGNRLLGSDGEDTVDNSHPSDLGFVRHADAFEPALRALLPKPMHQSERRPIEGYTDQQSYQVGEEIALHVSCAGRAFDLEIARLGGRREIVWTGTEIPGQVQAVPANASSHGCQWAVTRKLKVLESWPSGYYVGKLQTVLEDGKKAESELWFVVRSARPGKDTKILLQLATNTYNAYSNWGGYSLYAYNGREKVQGRRVSFNRPVHSQFNNWELPFVAWAEKVGYKLDFCVNSDLEFRPELLSNYKLVLSVGHDEYWSAPMRDNLEKFIAGGGNVAFFSGNTCCWQVRSEERGRALTCWKQDYRQDPFYDKGLTGLGADPSARSGNESRAENLPHRLLSSLWSHHLVARPENQLTGVGFLWGGYHRSHGQFMDGPGAFTVHQPEHWLFDGTGLKLGQAFGGADTIVGYECDGCELTMKDGLPVPTFRDGTPENFQVLATCPARWHPDDCEWYERWEKGRTGNAVLGVYHKGVEEGSATKGGTVITAGTTDWSHGLRKPDRDVERITRNVLDKLGK